LVLSVREGIIYEPIRVLARNNSLEFICEECKDIATHICQRCWKDCCDNCLEQHECEDYYAMPIVNSPRTGVCGYMG